MCPHVVISSGYVSFVRHGLWLTLKGVRVNAPDIINFTFNTLSSLYRTRSTGTGDDHYDEISAGLARLYKPASRWGLMLTARSTTRSYD